ncbi:MAG TPA: UbiA-like protein EboC [Fodinibius sp.]|nr:UbiA-like protein EboC [Fodinibius sp.]
MHSSSSILTTLRAGAELMRPANIVTAFADILAGFAAAGGSLSLFETLRPQPAGLGWLLLTTLGLYGGGVVFNDVFDAQLDARERPERAIPSGRIPVWGATMLGIVLLAVGIAAAFMANHTAGLLACGIAALALAYNYWAKHSVLWGPVCMGLCRAGNLLLGASIIPVALGHLWFLGLFPLAYIGAITLISQGEVHGGRQATGYVGLALIILVIGGLFGLAARPRFILITALPFIVLLSVLVVPAFYRAAAGPSPAAIRKAVRRGVLSLIILNSVLAGGFGGWAMGLLTALLLPVSMGLGRMFKVT